MTNTDLLREVKSLIVAGQYSRAIKPLEKLLTLLRFDFENGIDRERNGRAFNALARVRKDLLAGKLSPESYQTLRIPMPQEAKPAPKIEPKPEPKIEPKPAPSPKEDEKEEISPEEAALDNKAVTQFKWDEIPTITFADIAGLDECKALVERRVILPLMHPEMLQGYVNSGGGGVCLYGPPGTGKTMISAAIANRIGAKFCSITPSDLLQQGVGNTERALKALFAEARGFPCAVIYFDEMDSIAPKSTRSTAARQLRSEFLAQLQGISSYGKKSKNILFLICATNKPWDIDSAFLRPGRFGTKVYVGLPDPAARSYIVTHRLDQIAKMGSVEVRDDIDLDLIVDRTNGFNCADITNVLNNVEELSLIRAAKTGEKYICNADFILVLKKSVSSVQADDIIKLDAWRRENDAPIDFDDVDTKPEPEPEPAPEPAPEPSPAPEPAPGPEPEPAPAPEPSPTPAEPTSDVADDFFGSLDDGQDPKGE